MVQERLETTMDSTYARGLIRSLTDLAEETLPIEILPSEKLTASIPPITRLLLENLENWPS
jgi:hypothetical protein